VKLGDFLIGVLAWCALVAMATLFVAFLNRPPQPKLEIANTASGPWDFNNASDPKAVIAWRLNTLCTVTDRNLPVRDPNPTT
jgi:hypothetical protein